MTNEEAIKLLKSIVAPPDLKTAAKTKPFYDAIEKGIEALEELEKKEKEKNIKIKYDRIVRNAKPFKTYGDIIIVDRKQ